MNFKPTSMKSIVSSIAPLVLAMIAFRYKYCTDCDAQVLMAQQRQTAIIVLLASCLAIYILWSLAEKKEEPKEKSF